MNATVLIAAAVLAALHFGQMIWQHYAGSKAQQASADAQLVSSAQTALTNFAAALVAQGKWPSSAAAWESMAFPALASAGIIPLSATGKPAPQPCVQAVAEQVYKAHAAAAAAPPAKGVLPGK